MSDYILRQTREIVIDRANGICEYCLIAEADGYFRFQIDHVISLKHGGPSTIENLALACIFCNSYKGSDIGTLDSTANDLVRFYDPRKDRWNAHFGLDNVRIIGKSEIGTATIRILQFNHVDRISERAILQRVGRYPSDAAKQFIFEN